MLNIENEIRNIMVTKFGVDHNVIDRNMNVPLTSPLFGFTANMMCEFLLCLESTFGVLFTPDDFTSMSFRTFSEAVKSIKEKI